MYSEQLGRNMRRREARLNVSELVNCAITTWSTPQLLFIDKTIVIIIIIHYHCHHLLTLFQHRHVFIMFITSIGLDWEGSLHLIFILTLDQPTRPTPPFQTSPLQNQFLLFYSFSFFEILYGCKFFAQSWSHGRQFRIFSGLLAILYWSCANDNGQLTSLSWIWETIIWLFEFNPGEPEQRIESLLKRTCYVEQGAFGGGGANGGGEGVVEGEYVEVDDCQSWKSRGIFQWW